jgi:cytochrome c peroxidase
MSASQFLNVIPMRRWTASVLVCALCSGIALQVGLAGTENIEVSLEALGEALFTDANLSWSRTQSCASCHDPAFGFADPRSGPAGRAVSLGGDGVSVGTRNTPSVAYAAFSPVFHRDAKGNFSGGQFLDGRAATLEDQAGQPMLNPVEMAMPDEASVVARIKEKPAYIAAFKKHFGTDIFNDDSRAFAALSKAIAAFERSPAVSPFDSKYDRSLRGEYKMTAQEELGRVLFFSTQFTNCHLCHQLEPPGSARETFTNYSFHNIGTPGNPALVAMGQTGPDRGLREHSDIMDRAQEGRFKVPSLRNVAVTGPYMHNGVFQDLRTTILFYNKYNSTAAARQIDPETGKPWAAPQVPGTLSLKELQSGPALDDRRIDALVAFLKTLTDQRYEHLLAP